MEVERTVRGRIVEQLKKLGSSCDWERERFTMDEGLSNAVKRGIYKSFIEKVLFTGEREL